MPNSPAVPRLLAVLLALISGAALALRLAIIFHLPDGEADAYGHFGAARALLENPANLAVHWVWLPGWHYALSALIGAGVTFQGVRVMNAVAQTFAPLLLRAFVMGRPTDPVVARTELVAWVAALAWTVAPLPNMLATSAQAETVFTIAVLGTAYAIDRRRFALAGVTLGGACLIRYEAWGALVALLLRRAVKRDSVGLPALIVPCLLVAAWIATRRFVDGQWLAFARDTQQFVTRLRTTSGTRPIDQEMSFFVQTPWSVMGPALLLVPIGVRRIMRSRWIVPGGIAGFLLVSHLASGSLDIDRYLTSLMPFACYAAAEAIIAASELVPRLPNAVAVGLMIASLALTTRARLATFVASTLAREPALRRMQLECSRQAPSPSMDSP